jgi:hypothetical protein
MLAIVSLNFAVVTILDTIAEHVINSYGCERMTFAESGVPATEQNAPLSAVTCSTAVRRMAMPSVHMECWYLDYPN